MALRVQGNGVPLEELGQDSPWVSLVKEGEFGGAHPAPQKSRSAPACFLIRNHEDDGTWVLFRGLDIVLEFTPYGSLP